MKGISCRILKCFLVERFVMFEFMSISGFFKVIVWVMGVGNELLLVIIKY